MPRRRLARDAVQRPSVLAGAHAARGTARAGRRAGETRAAVARHARRRRPARGRERIAYRDLGVEQLGSVYESLLDYQPSAGPVALVPGSGVRKSTGTFYTPQPIADYLVRSTLGPLVQDAEPEAILRLRVVDPSMGSGAFLVAACHYLAQAYEAALVRSGGCHPGDFSDADRAAIRRTISERCLYGVDINPMAVQLARLSLWLTTLAADRPLTFLDHRLQTGDSLLGAWLENLRRAPAHTRPARRDAASGHLFDDGVVASTLRDVLPVRFSLELTPDDTLEHVHAKERALSALADQNSELSRWKRVADVWCASWLSDGRDGVPAAAFSALTDHVLAGRGSLPQHVAARFMDRPARSRRRASCFTGSWSSRKSSSTPSAGGCPGPVSTRSSGTRHGKSFAAIRRASISSAVRRVLVVGERARQSVSAVHRAGDHAAAPWRTARARAAVRTRDRSRRRASSPAAAAGLRRRRAGRPGQPARRLRHSSQRQVPADDGDEGRADDTHRLPVGRVRSRVA